MVSLQRSSLHWSLNRAIVSTSKRFLALYIMQMTKHPRVGVACRETCEELGALLSAEMKCPPHEVGQALANPSP